MDIMVLIKQVPMSSDLGMDEETGVIKRESGDTKMNPYDLYALETAFRIREETGGTVSVLTMGPPQAEQVIREAFMMGADKGYLLTDPAFAGSDVLATSYALAQGIQTIRDFNLIICGKQTTDGDTAQVASECSELENQFGLRIMSFGHAGDGNLHIYALRDDLDQNTWEEKLKAVFDRMYARANEIGGKVSGEHGIGYAKKGFLSRAEDPATMLLFKGIKNTFDQKGIMNPGKIV